MATKTRSVRFTMVLSPDQQSRIEHYQSEMARKNTFIMPARTAIIRQALDDFLRRAEKETQKQ